MNDLFKGAHCLPFPLAFQRTGSFLFARDHFKNFRFGWGIASARNSVRSPLWLFLSLPMGATFGES